MRLPPSKFLLFFALFLPLACSGGNDSPLPSISKEAKRGLNTPVHCKTAEQDIKLLKDERASVAKQMLSGVRAVFPFAAVAGILSGDYNDRMLVASGEYNRDIDAKIMQIETVCGLK